MYLPGAGAGNREEELMTALQLLLDRLNTGQIPISPAMYQQLQTGTGPAGSNTESTTVNFSGTRVRLIKKGSYFLPLKFIFHKK